MLRKTTKTTEQMKIGFLKSQFRDDIMNLIGGRAAKLYAPPCPLCLENLEWSINKNDMYVSSFMAKIVLLRVTQIEENAKMVALLESSVLTSTSWNGLGIIEMITRVSYFFRIDMSDLMCKTLITPTQNTWKEIVDFMLIYQRKADPDITVAWARVIDDTYFTELSCTNHCVLAAFLCRCEEYALSHIDGNMESAWVRKDQRTLERYHAVSEYLKSCLLNDESEINACFKEAVPVVSLLRKDKQKQILPKTAEDLGIISRQFK